MRLFSAITILILFICQSVTINGQDTTKLFIASWNVQNLFDTVDDPEINDEEFLPEGSRNWTNERLSVKMDNLVKVIRYMNDGQGPDILALQEVENEALVDSLVSKCKVLKNYGIAYRESDDKRGIDVGVIYNKDLFRLISVIPHRIPLDFNTRPELEVGLKTMSGDTLIMIVNHWPSRWGGKEESEVKRVAASDNLIKIIKEKKNVNTKYIILGDFNDEPIDKSITTLINYKDNNFPELLNLAAQLCNEGFGSFYYRSDWDMLDQMIISSSLLQGNIEYCKSSFMIIKPEFMVTRSGNYKDSPFPTYGGRNYLGGYSDHFPVGAYFLLIKEDH